MDTEINAIDVDNEVKIPKALSLPILKVITEFRQQHGLKHEHYCRYRTSCSRKLQRLRKVTNFTNKHSKYRRKKKTETESKFTKKWVTAETLTDETVMKLPIFEAERSWAAAMDKKCALGNISGKKMHVAKMHFTRAVIHAKSLAELAKNSEICDIYTKLEALAYAGWLVGICSIEHKKWDQATKALTVVRAIFEALAETSCDASLAKLYSDKFEEIEPQIRLCKFNSANDSTDASMSNIFESKLDLEDNGYVGELIAELRQKKVDEVACEGTKQIAAENQSISKLKPSKKTEPPLLADLTEKYIKNGLLEELQFRLDIEDEDYLMTDEDEEESDEAEPQNTGITGMIKSWFYGSG